MKLPENYDTIQEEVAANKGSRSVIHRPEPDSTLTLRLVCDEPLFFWELWPKDKSGKNLKGDDDKSIAYRALKRSDLPQEHISKDAKPQLVMAMTAIDRSTEEVVVYAPTQVSVHDGIARLVRSKAWGDTSDYDIEIYRPKAGQEKHGYGVTPCNKEPLSGEARQAWASTKCNLYALLNNEDPFTSTWTPEDLDEEELENDEIPF